MGRQRSQGYLLMPPAETGITAQKPSRTTAKHLLDGSAIPDIETETSNSFPLDVLLYFLKTSLICIHICPNNFGRILELFSFTKKYNTPIPSLTSSHPPIPPPHTETHSLIYFFSRRQHSCNWGDSRWCRIRAANLGPLSQS